VGLPVDESLLIASLPLDVPAVVGLNRTVTAVDCPGFSVTGRLAAETEKPAPDALALLIERGAVPADLRVIDSVAEALRLTFPKERLFALQLMVATEGSSCNVRLFVALDELAIRTADWDELTADAVTVKVALDALAGTVTLAGAESAELLDVTFTLTPPLAAGPLSWTVQRSVPAPVIDEFAQLSPLNTPLTPI